MLSLGCEAASCFEESVLAAQIYLGWVNIPNSTNNSNSNGCFCNCTDYIMKVVYKYYKHLRRRHFEPILSKTNLQKEYINIFTFHMDLIVIMIPYIYIRTQMHYNNYLLTSLYNTAIPYTSKKLLLVASCCELLVVEGASARASESKKRAQEARKLARSKLARRVRIGSGCPRRKNESNEFE